MLSFFGATAIAAMVVLLPAAAAADRISLIQLGDAPTGASRAAQAPGTATGVVVHTHRPGYPRLVSECLIAAYERAHLEGCLRLFEAEGWQTYADHPERTHCALTGAGSTALVGLVDGRVVAICQLQSDGHVQAHLTTLVVASELRRQGIARRLLREALQRGGGLRIDLISYFDPFYEAVASRRFSGFRITREDLSLGEAPIRNAG
jgi:GNAT superfamily N-acetyltransferase